MEEIILEVEARDAIGRAKAKDLREGGFIPAVIYGQGQASAAIKISHSAFVKLVHQHRVENAILTLKLKDEKKSKGKACIIKEIQYHPLHGDILHVDFNEISLTKAIKVNVPVAAQGEPAGVKQEGGSLEHILWEIEVECLPTEIPQNVEVDVSQMKIGDSIYVKDLKLPAGVKILNDPEAIVLTVSEPMKEEVAAAPVEGEEAKEPEVIKEKKEVPAEEGEAAEEPKKEEKEKK